MGTLLERSAPPKVRYSAIAPRPRWRSVLRDLWANKQRTGLMALSIAIGVFAVGMIATTQSMISSDLSAAYASISPASATIYTTQPFDESLLTTIRTVSGVKAAEGRRSLSVRMKVGSDQNDEWRNLELTAIPDYRGIQIDKLRPVSGAWPPLDREVLIERSWLDALHVSVGDTVLVEKSGGLRRELRVSGVVHDLSRPPALFTDTAGGYITLGSLEWLGEPRAYDQVRLLTAATNDRSANQEIANLVRAKIERSGLTVLWTSVPEPGEHPLSYALRAISLLLGALGLLALVLGGLLVTNTTSAQVTRQIRQIGIMKAIGATRAQIAAMYLVAALALGLLGLLVGIPLAAVGAGALAGYTAGLINFDVQQSLLPPTNILGLEMAVGLAVPILAALFPITVGTGVTVREAIGGAGLGSDSAPDGILNRLVRRIGFLPRPMLLSLRNTFRRKGRLALTLLTLTLGGAIFIAVCSVRESTLQSLDDGLRYFQYDIELSLDGSYAPQRIQNAIASVRGVTRAVDVGMAGARRTRPNGSESENLVVVAVPPQTDVIEPTLLRGRWLQPQDENAIVVTTALLRTEPGIDVGDSLALKIGGRVTTWRVVGVAQYVLSDPIAYTNYTYFVKSIPTASRSEGVWVVARDRDPGLQTQLAKTIEEQLKTTGIHVSSVRTIAQSRELAEAQFSVLVVFLLLMTIVVAAVGGLGLTGTMSLNVLERTRETGVMRTIGATDAAVRGIYLAEGIAIGILSWLGSAVFAIPLSRLLGDEVGRLYLGAPLSYVFSAGGVVAWLAIVIILSAIASVLPAWSASRLTIREVLAYE